MDKQALRNALLASIPRRTKLVTVKMPNGPVEVELRQLTMAERDAVTARATKDGKVSTTELAVQYVLACSYVPGTDTLALEPADAEVIRASWANGHFERLAAAAMRLHGDEEAAAEGKDSAPTNGA